MPELWSIMFGYVRPLKSELLMREFSRYQSVYCGICKSIGENYGLLPRLTTGYDLTLMALLLLALSADQPPVAAESCILNPLKQKPIVKGGDVIERCAGLSILLAYHKAKDDRRDEGGLKGTVAAAALRSSYRRAKERYPRSETVIKTHLQRLTELEKGPPDLKAAEIFGDLLSDLMQIAAEASKHEPPVCEALKLVGRDLGTWIYLCDAIDDLKRDCNNDSWNPFANLETSEAYEMARARMQAAEQSLDRTAALLPYTRDGGIIANVVTLGLPAMREMILAGEKPGRL
ncbi:MAG: DUF5685 family protein [Saccharofermentanales bacterium]